MSENESNKRSDLIQIFREKKLTMSFAESCTGGKLSALITELAGVSDVYLGSVVSYSNEAKVNLLGVRREALFSEGAVSELVARQMAQGVREKLQSEWSVAITGIAGPSGGTSAKPVGTVCFAVCGPQFESSDKKLFSGSRIQIQSLSADYAMELLLKSVLQNS
jgi:nicotinamide-nucleotide amidase